MDSILQTTTTKSRRQGTVTQRYKGSFQLRYTVVDTNGKRKQVNETVKGTKKEAEKILRERLSAVDNGSHIDKSKKTVSQFMARWMETCVATNCTLRTAIGHQDNIQRYIIPAIGKVAMQNLTSSQIQGIYAGRLGRGLSNTTVLHLHRVLREALGHAVKCGDLARNVADAACPPRREQKQMPMWDVPTIQEFLDLSEESRPSF